MKFQWHRWTRKAHRYLGVLIGIQFMAWTIGGLYFSWTDLDKVHGSDLIGPAPVLVESVKTAPLDGIVGNVLSQEASVIHRIDFLTISESAAIYRISYTDKDGERGAALVDAVTGQVRQHLSEEESSQLASARYAGTGELVESRRIESTGPHDEYRELPLPAYAFTFNDERLTTIYVAPAHARITAVRNGTWRVFDFLWMLHTMDYEGRDDFNNLLLQAFAVFGLLTLLSGFALFLFSSKVFRNANRRRTS
jgi:uncharacterized iron-regulated membrane protein